VSGYSAGLIDGEGYIGIQEAGGSWQVRLKVTMTDKGLSALRMMQRLHGGKIDGPRKPQNEQARESYTWRLNGKAAVELIAELRPLLIVKGEAADVALAFQQMVDSAPHLPNGRAQWSDPMRERATMLMRRIQDANRRGPDPDPPTLPKMRPLAVYQWGWWWEPEEDLFGPVEFTGRIPTSGMMCSGHLYELPTPAHPMDGSGSSSTPGLPTPRATRGGSATETTYLLDGADRKGLLPTPTVSDTNGAGAHGDGGADLRTAVSLLPTPAVNDMGAAYTPEMWDQWTATMQAKHGNGNGHGKSLAIKAQRLLPTPRATDGTKGGPNQRGSSGDLMLPSAVTQLLPTPTSMDAHSSGGSTPSNVTLTDAVVRTSLGATTNPRFDGGKQPPDDQPPHPPN
jgi:hypothetical protein